MKMENAILSIFAVLLLASATPQAQSVSRTESPNVLFLFADDMRADAVRAWGNPHIRTPNLDRLVRGGFSFRGNYIFGGNSGAVCVPSRAMLMSGKTWFNVNAPTLNGARLLPELLGENGYATFATGKWHNGQASWLRAFQRGKAVMFGGMSDHTKVPVRDLGPDGKLTEVRAGEKFSSELFADAAIEFLQNHDGKKPFFAYVAFTSPHDPRQPPLEYREMYYRDLPPLPANFLPQLPFDNGMMNGGRDENLGAWPRTEKMIRDQLAEYYGLITHMDEQIGRILAALEKTGQAQNTIIIFAADNGLALGSHGLLGKQSVFEHSMRTPLIIAGPGVPRGKSTRAFTYLHDLFPTLCDALGVQPPAGLEGESLRPLWEGKKTSVRDSVFLPYMQVQRAVRDQRWKLIAYPKIGHLQLFDLQSDPHETRNLIARPESAPRVARLMKLMKQWQGRVGDTLELPAENKTPEKIDLTGKRRAPDQWQPDWIVKKYFEQRPNVLLVITDDQGYGDLGLHGNEHVRTPNLDRLGRESIRFDRFFVSPLCAPTRASLLTGRYSLRTGAKGVAQGLETMRGEEVTVAEALRDAGYRTGLFGKWHNGEHYPYTPNGQGFDESFGFNLGHWNNYFDTTLERNGRKVKTRGFITDVLTDAALEFINANRQRPFFCYLSYNAPHSPLQVPDKYFDYYKSKGLDDTLASVYGMVESLDENVGRVLARLDELKLRDDTIVIFMTDNGPNGARFNGGMRGAKGGLHEGGSRVPFFLRWPARFKEARLVKPIAAHIDVFPTLIELCGAPMPKTLPQDGRSLVPLLEGKEENWPDRALFTQHVAPRPERMTGAVRTQQYRLVNEGRGWELFDMLSDPGQQKNIAAERPEVAKRLIEAYQNWLREALSQTGPPRPPIPVGHAEQPVVELPTPQSEFTGGLRFSGRHPNNAWLTNWTNIGATVEWELDVAWAGKYEVGLQYLCPKADAGSRVEIRAAGASTATTVRATTGGQVNSPDRVPRTEVYEMKWATLAAGKLSLPQGKTKLTVRALTKPGGAVMDLKAVTLKRVN